MATYTSAHAAQQIAGLIKRDPSIYDVSLGPLETQLTFYQYNGQKFLIDVRELVNEEIIIQDRLDDIEDERGDFR